MEPAQLRHRRGQARPTSPTSSPPPTGTPTPAPTRSSIPRARRSSPPLLLAAASPSARSIRPTCGSPTRATTSPSACCASTGYQLLGATRSPAEINAPEKQRGGVYGTAEKILAFLTNRSARPGSRPAPTAWSSTRTSSCSGTGTLYSLSKEGKRLRRARSSPASPSPSPTPPRSSPSAHPAGGCRCRMVVVLDEAANVCRWPELPNLYSHYGSRGHRADDDPAVLVARRASVGPRRHAEALVAPRRSSSTAAASPTPTSSKTSHS